jgi:hypothetical protein
MKIGIVGTDREFEVGVIDDKGLTIRKFAYLNAQQARRAAAAWSTTAAVAVTCIQLRRNGLTTLRLMSSACCHHQFGGRCGRALGRQRGAYFLVGLMPKGQVGALSGDRSRRSLHRHAQGYPTWRRSCLASNGESNMGIPPNRR